MMPGSRPQRRGWRRWVADDAGMTLNEVVVAQAVMGIFLVIFTAAALQMYRTTNGAESHTTAQSRLHIATQRLDKEIRYASSIEKAVHLDQRWYVEYLTTHSGRSVCTRLMLDPAAGQLKYRTWRLGSFSDTRTDWTMMADGVGLANDTDPPFLTIAPDTAGNMLYHRLKVHVAAVGEGAAGGSTELNRTFTAENSSVDDPANSLITSTAAGCTEGRSTP